MLGVGEYIKVLTVEDSDNYKLLDSISESLEGFGKEPVFSYTDRNEHASFARAGIRAVDLKISPALFYHTDMDTVDTIMGPKGYEEKILPGRIHT